MYKSRRDVYQIDDKQIKDMTMMKYNQNFTEEDRNRFNKIDQLLKRLIDDDENDEAFLRAIESGIFYLRLLFIIFDDA